MSNTSTVSGIRHRFFLLRRLVAAIGAAVVVAVVLGSCGDPEVPVALSSTTDPVLATEVPVPPTPTPLPPPTAEPTPPSGAPTPVPVAQPGLSADSVRLAVIFDDETGGIADQLFRDAWLGAQAWQNEVNDNGGLGGRTVEVVPIDARLFDHRAAIEKVCEGDFFAIVGSHSLGDDDGAELLGTEDCNIADFPGQVYGSRRAISEVTFVANPFLNDVRQAGPARYLVEKYPDASTELGLLRYFALDLTNAVERQREMATSQGMEVVFDLAADLAEDPTERIVGRWEDGGAQSLVWTADPGRLIELLGVLEEKPTFVLCDWGCYSQQFLLDGGEDVEGVYTWIPHSHFGAARARGDLTLYQVQLARLDAEAGWSEVGLQSWMAGRLFEVAFARLIQQEEAPEREQLISAARSIDFFTANSVLSATDPAAGDPTPCFVLMVVRNGEWVQEHPMPPRDSDCDEENLFELVTSTNVGVPLISAASSEDVEPAPVEDEDVLDLEAPEDLDE